mgnify:CR=1 FL=1
MYRLFCLVLLMFGTAMMLGGCAPKLAWEDNDAFADFLAIKDVNDSLAVTYLDFMSEGQIGSSISLDIRNSSNNKIGFPDDWGVRIYLKTDDVWMEVSNKTTYYQTHEIVLEPANDEFGSVGSTIANPDILNESNPVTIRVIVVGNIMNGDVLTDEQAAAYVDITLHP